MHEWVSIYCRTQLLVWLPALGGATTSHQFSQDFTGFQFASASPSRQQFWCGNVYAIKRHTTLPIWAFWSLQSRQGVNYALRGLELFCLLELRASDLHWPAELRGVRTRDLAQSTPSLRTPNCRWAPSSAGWRLSFSSTRDPLSGAVVTDQRVYKYSDSTQLNLWLIIRLIYSENNPKISPSRTLFSATALTMSATDSTMSSQLSNCREISSRVPQVDRAKATIKSRRKTSTESRPKSVDKNSTARAVTMNRW